MYIHMHTCTHTICTVILSYHTLFQFRHIPDVRVWTGEEEDLGTFGLVAAAANDSNVITFQSQWSGHSPLSDGFLRETVRHHNHTQTQGSADVHRLRR